MFCENCGKSIIRGYNFCLECGTPVPAENLASEQAEQAAGDQGMPQIEPLSNEGGTLVFCPNCGMHMQSSNAFCEKCGQQLQANNQGGGNYSNLPKNGSVPLWNTESVDYGYETMSEGEIQQINNFMNGGSALDEAAGYEDYQSIGGDNTFANSIGGADRSVLPDISGSAAELEAITAQFSNMAQAAQASDYSMPAIGSQDNMIQDDTIKVDNFAMDTSYVDDEYVDQGALPVIEGASMEYDPDEPEPEDPNAFVMTPEAFSDITPAYEPEAEVPAYEPEVEVPTYEPVAEVPTYEPVAEVSTYEPEAEVPAYEPEAEVPAYEPVAEVPTYEPEAEAEEPAYEIPLYGSDSSDSASYAGSTEPEYAADIPLFGAAEEAPAYDNTPVYNAAEEVPAYDVPTYDAPASDENSYAEAGIAAAVAAAGIAGGLADAEEHAAYEEPAPYEEPAAYEAPEAYEEPVSEYVPAADAAPAQEYSAAPDYNTAADYNAAASTAAVASAVEAEEPAADLGRLLYCRNCGQDMYELETVCKYCGAPKRPEYTPPRSRDGKAKNEPFKLFGIFSIPALIVIAVVIVGVILLVLPSLNKDEITSSGSSGNTSAITGNEQLNADNTTASTDGESSTPAESTASTTTSATTTTPAESEPAVTESNEPAVSESTEAPETVETPSTTPASTPETTTPASSTTPKTTTTPKATTTTKPVVTTPSAGTAYTPSATIKSQNKERDKMIEAFELMSEEVGKLDLLARTTSYAVMFDSRDADTAGKSFYKRDFAAALLKNIKNGKSSVASAVAAAKPTTAELNTAYKALCKLQDKYVEYYTYVVDASKFGSYESKCDTYLSSFTSYAASNFTLSAMNTSAQSARDRAEYYASVASNAVAAAENASAAYSTLRGKVAKLTDDSFSGQFLTVMNDNMSTYLKAAKYTQAVASYCAILSSAPSDYSNAYSGLKTARDNLNNLADMFALAQYDNTLSNFKSSTSSYIASANSGAAKAKNAL